MIVGHFFLAVVLAVLYARYRGLEDRQALILAAVAGVFAFLPDIDIVFAARDLLIVMSTGLSGMVETFWSNSEMVHRGLTHSLITLVLSGTAFSLYCRYSSKILVLLTVFGGMVAGALLGNVFTIGVMFLFISVGFALAHVSQERMELPDFIYAVLAGLVIHPFGDVFTGTPPEFLFPTDFTILTERIVMFQDPVINLLSIFLLEFSLLAIGLYFIAELRDVERLKSTSELSIAGIAYAPAALYLSPPTLETSYHFVFSVLGFGALITLVALYFSEEFQLERDPDKLLIAGFNFVVAVIAGFMGYLAFYILL